MSPLPHETAPLAHQVGLVVLQSDESLERDLRLLLPRDTELLVSRVPSGEEVTPETLAAMEDHLAAAAGLFPRSARFAALGYGCTSGTAQIGPARVGECLRQGTVAEAVTEPVSALVAACGAMGLRRLGVLSPYVAAVSDRLRDQLATQGIETPAFGSFETAEEAVVARIRPDSIIAAAVEVAGQGGIDALFLSCTNLRALAVIEPLEAELGLPVLSSNQVLAWHLARLAGIPVAADAPGRLFAV